jgi:hypothetical protein
MWPCRKARGKQPGEVARKVAAFQVKILPDIKENKSHSLLKQRLEEEPQKWEARD